jgi:hypothetical protein
MKPRRTVRVQVNERELRVLFDVPDDAEIVAVGATSDPPRAYVIVSSDRFPEVPPDAMSPIESLDLAECRTTVSWPAAEGQS